MDVNYFQRINFHDWPLKVLYGWFELLIDPEERDCIRRDVFYALDNSQQLNRSWRISDFRDMIFAKPKTCGRICRNRCGEANYCATAGNFKRVLLANGLDEYGNLDVYEGKVLYYFFFKLNDAINQVDVKHRIGLLVLFLDKSKENDFIKKQRHLIMSQLSNKFYVTDYLLVDARDHIFGHIKHYVDAVVIIADSEYLSRDLDGYYTMLSGFRFLKIFVVKTEDLASQSDETIRSHFQLKLPKNEIIIYDWLKRPEGFPDTIQRHLTPGLRLKIAISSYFVRKKRPSGNVDVVATPPEDVHAVQSSSDATVQVQN